MSATRRLGFRPFAWATGLVLAASSAFAAERLASPSAATPAAAAAEVDRLLSEEVFVPAGNANLAPRADDEIFLRRVYLDLVGEHPTAAEASGFALDPSPDKRNKVIDKLLADPRYGRNWARYWRDVIMYRRTSEFAGASAVAAESYLTEQFNQNVGWDKIAASFVTAEGPAFETGPTALIMAQSGDPNDVASEVSRIFLGIQIQCAQCHDHPTDRWKREQFHQLAAFFPRVAVTRSGFANQQPSIMVAGNDDAPFVRRSMGSFGSGSREHYMPDLKDPSSQGKEMTPVFFATNKPLATGTLDSERREILAAWLTGEDNPWFAKAIVNRLWAELVGEGFYEPVDDLGPDRTPSAPQTVEYLAAQFAASKYDVKNLFRTILTTAAYQRESRARRLENEPPFAANVAQRLRADQLYNVLVGIIGYDPDSGAPQNPNPLQRFNSGFRAQFGQLFGYDPSARRDELTVTIPQALSLMNSQFSNRAIIGRSANTYLAKLVDSGKDDEAVVLDLYLTCLAREPNEAELQVCLDHLQSGSDRAASFEDLLWSLLNSKEILFRR